MLNHIFTSVGVANLETDTGGRDNLASFRILFHDFNFSFKGGVVNEVAIGFAIFTDIHIKCRHKLFTFKSFGLLDGVNTIRQPIGSFSKAIRISYEQCSFSFSCVLIRTCTLEEYLKDRIFFGMLNLSRAIVCMFDDGDLATDDCFVHIDILGVKLYAVVAGICIHIINSGIKHVSFTGGDFTNCPFIIITARIVFGNKPTIFIRCVGVNKVAVFINAVNCAFKGSIALCFTIRPTILVYHLVRGRNFKGHYHWHKTIIVFGISPIEISVHLEHICSPFLENILYGSACYGVPCNVHRLLGRDNISCRCAFLFQYIIRANEDIIKDCYAICIGVCGFINLDSRIRCTCKAESHILYEAVFGSLLHTERATLEFVIEGLVGHFVPCDRHRLCCRSNIVILCINLGHSISGVTCDEDIGEGCNATCVGSGG